MLIEPPHNKHALGAVWIALALVLAAFLGASLGLIWHSTGLAGSEEAQAGEDPGEDAADDAESEKADQPSAPAASASF